MTFYTVTKPGGVKNEDFEPYKGLLEEIGVDLSRAPRLPQPGMTRSLHMWTDRGAADRFLRELRARSGDASWILSELSRPQAELGPLAPLDILVLPSTQGCHYRLTPDSQERVMKRFPNARLSGDVFLPHHAAANVDRAWRDVAVRLTGLADVQLAELGGYRIYEQGGRTVYELAPTAA